MKRTHSRHKLAAGVLCSMLLASGLALAGGDIASRSGALFDYSRDSRDVVVKLTQDLAVRDEDPGPSLTIYGDGRVVVHQPAYMKNAGDYETRLDAAEMTRLIASLVDNGVADFDAKDIRQECRTIDRARAKEGTLSMSVSESATIIELNLDRYTPAGTSGALKRDFEKELSWSGIGDHARMYPDVQALQRLAGAEQLLTSIMDRKDLRRVEVSR